MELLGIIIVCFLCFSSGYLFRVIISQQIPNGDIIINGRNILAEQFDEIKSSIKEKEQKVIALSNSIKEVIGDNYTNRGDVVLTLGRYRVVKTSRCFSNGWVNLLEIVPINYGSSVGFINTKNPSWIKVEGTRTINLPPKKVINEFFSELENIIPNGKK